MQIRQTVQSPKNISIFSTMQTTQSPKVISPPSIMQTMQIN